MGIVCHEREQFDASIEWYQKYIKIFGEAADALSEIGENYYYKSEFEKAEEYHLKSLSKRPNHAKTTHRLALVYFAQANYEKSLETFAQLIKIFPEDSLYLSDYGHAHLKNFSYEEAEALFKQSIELDDT